MGIGKCYKPGFPHFQSPLLNRRQGLAGELNGLTMPREHGARKRQGKNPDRAEDSKGHLEEE